MDEYVNRETAIRALLNDSPEQVGYSREDAADCIRYMDAADVAPVVRCKGCKYSCKDGTGRTCEGYWYELSEFAVSVEDDGFCSYGERKDGVAE